MCTPTTLKSEQTLTPYGKMVNDISSCVGMTALITPTNVTKVNLQMAERPKEPVTFVQTIRHTIKHIPKTPIQAMAGIQGNLLGIVPAQASGFFAQGVVMKLCANMDPQSAEIYSILAGGGVATTIQSPVDLLAITAVRRANKRAALTKEGKIEEAKKIRSGPMHDFAHIRIEAGLRAFNRGIGCTYIRETAVMAGIFSIIGRMDNSLKTIISNKKTREISAAAITGALVGAATAPVDYANTILKSQLGNGHSSMETLKRIWQTQGSKAFLKGSGVRGLLLAQALVAVTQLKDNIPKILPDALHTNKS